MPRFTIAALLACWVLAQPLYAEEARVIMQRVLDRDNGFSEVSRTKLATCRYVKKSKRLVCAEAPRVKVFESVRKDFSAADGEDSKSVMILRKPAGEKGIGFLQYDYEVQGRDSDQWMYLAALGKVKRIIAGSDDEPKTGNTTYDLEQIMDMIPHRNPFLMIDRVIDVIPDVRAVGIKTLTGDEPYFKGHFPGHSIMPGVLIIEAMAQTSAV